MLPTLTQIKANDHYEELLREAQDHRRTRPRGHGSSPPVDKRPRTTARAIAVGCVLALSTVAVAKAATPGFVIGPHGKVASQGYGEWCYATPGSWP